MAGRLTLAIRLRFHNHAPQQLAIRLALHQQAADQLGSNQLGGAGEEGLGEGWEVLGGRGGYGDGFGDRWRRLGGGAYTDTYNLAAQNRGKMETTSDREKQWHNRRFANGGDEWATSKVRFAYSACTYAQQAFSSLQNASNQRVLDIDCGRGIERAKQFTLQGCAYTGIDISEECISANIDDCIQAGINAHFICEDANTLSALKGKKYDLVILSGTLHHLELDKALPALAEITEENGKVIMWEPMGTNPASNISRMLTPRIRTPDEHPLNFADLKEIKKFFPVSTFQFHTLTALAAAPLAMAPSKRIQQFSNTISLLLGSLDEKLGRIPIIKRLHWIVIITAERHSGLNTAP